MNDYDVDENAALDFESNEIHSRVTAVNLAGLSFSSKLKDVNYLSFFLIGIALLWPWNSFLTASLYFQHDVFDDTTVYARIYTSTMMTVSTLTSVVSNVTLSNIQRNYSQRIVTGFLVQIFVFLTLCGIVLIRQWLSYFVTFTCIMVLVVTSSVATACSQTGALAMSNVFGAEYNHCVLLGQAVAGVLPSSVLFLVSIFNQRPEQTTWTINFYFLTTSLMALVCILVCRRSEIGATDREAAEITHNEPKINIPFMAIFLKIRLLLLSIFFVFCVTLIFPVFASNTLIVSLPMRNSVYIPFIFMVWNFGDLSGRFIAEKSFNSSWLVPRWVFLLSVLRTLMLPVFFAFNVRNLRKNSHLGVLLDLAYIAWQFLFGISSGLLATTSFMNVSKYLTSESEQKAAGGVTNVFLSLGLAAGSILSYLFAYMVAKI